MLAKSTLAGLITLGGSVAAIINATPGQAQVRGECRVTSTQSGLWTRAELNCGEPEGSRPRVARVEPDALRTCPLLAGDRVAVSYLYDDPTRQPRVTAALARGDGGPSSGDWCTRGFAPGRFSAPCSLEENPPRDQRTPTLGQGYTRTSVGTLFRPVDGSNLGVGVSGCTPATLKPGVYRIYVQRSVWRRTWVPCVRDPNSLCEDTTYETRYFEGGIYVDGGLTPVDSVTDSSPFVRGWQSITPSDATAQTPAFDLPAEGGVDFTPVRVATDTIVLEGIRFTPMRVATDTIVLAGIRFTPMRVATDTIVLAGIRFTPIRVATDTIVLAGIRFTPMRIATDTIVMIGIRR